MRKITKAMAKDFALTSLQIVFGAALYAAGFRLFLYTNDIPTGGLTGISMIINFLSGMPVGVMTIIMNIPLFLFSWKQFGLRFMLSSLAGMTLSSVFVDLLGSVNLDIIREPLLAALYGGAIYGLGLGLVYRGNGTTGGSDIVAKMLRHRYQHVNLSTFLMVLDVAVALAFGLIFDKIDRSMYSVVAMFIASKTIDFVLFGAINSKICYIISDAHEAIKDAIMQQMDRGVTFLHGEGGYSGTEKKVILCVIKRNQIVTLKKLVRELDEHAFMMVSDSHEVFGEGFSYIGSD